MNTELWHLPNRTDASLSHVDSRGSKMRDVKVFIFFRHQWSLAVWRFSVHSLPLRSWGGREQGHGTRWSIYCKPRIQPIGLSWTLKLMSCIDIKEIESNGTPMTDDESEFIITVAQAWRGGARLCLGNVQYNEILAKQGQFLFNPDNRGDNTLCLSCALS